MLLKGKKGKLLAAGESFYKRFSYKVAECMQFSTVFKAKQFSFIYACFNEAGIAYFAAIIDY